MLKINEDTSYPQHFGSLIAGDFFCVPDHDGLYYIKISLSSCNGHLVNAVSLKTGCLAYFMDTVNVYEKDATLYFENK